MPTKQEFPTLRWDLSTDAIKELTENLIKRSKETQDKVAAVTDPTFENTIKVLADDESMFASFDCMCTFPAYVSPDKDVRKVSSECDKKLREHSIESSMREDVYKVVMAYKAKEEQLDAESQRFLDKLLQSFERNGLSLPLEKREKLKTLKKRISELGIQFSQNLNEDTTSVKFTREELDGMPEDWLSGLKKDGDLYIVTLKYPDLFPVLKHAKVEETRKKMELTSGTKCQEANTPLLEEAIAIRQEMADLFGAYATHADYVLEIRMAKKPDAVLSFLKELRDKLHPLAEKEKEKLLDLKRSEKAERGEPFDGKINSWDFQYYHTMLMEKEYDVNDEVIKVYFPMQTVTSGLLGIYQTLLGLRFEEVPEPHVWHPEVRMFNVFDAASSNFVGQFYLDLYPREGKFGHAAAFLLQKGLQTADGGFQKPAAAMVANFSKATADRPSLLKHSEVVTFFHEFGHIMHQVCSKAKYARMSGSAVERDFVEAPSQMLENWCWEAESLKLMSGHFEPPHGPIPEDVLSKMIAAKNVNAGLLNLRQIFFGMFDMTIHTSRTVDTAAVWGKLRPQVTLIEHTPGTNPSASFGHMMGGYDAGYYGYLWSQVFSADMFHSRFKREGILNPSTGADYRKVILERGGSLDGDVLLREFLGRDPVQDFFLVSIGLQSTALQN